MTAFTSRALALLAASAAVSASPVSHAQKRDVITPLPESASETALKFQPVLDFDTDSCYNTAAIAPDGTTNPGLQHKNTGITENCRKTNRLENSNAYSRQRCNNGWCAIITELTVVRYDYYFEKDVATKGSPVDGGHRHEWENIVVFIQDDQLKGVAVTCHDGYGSGTETPELQDGTHPKVVYHKEGGLTHCFRLANGGEDPENDFDVWYRSPLVGWDGWPGSTRDQLNGAWSGGISPKLDYEFSDWLNKAKHAVHIADEFDPSLDA